MKKLNIGEVSQNFSTLREAVAKNNFVGILKHGTPNMVVQGYENFLANKGIGESLRKELEKGIYGKMNNKRTLVRLSDCQIDLFVEEELTEEKDYDIIARYEFELDRAFFLPGEDVNIVLLGPQHRVSGGERYAWEYDDEDLWTFVKALEEEKFEREIKSNLTDVVEKRHQWQFK